MKMKEALAIGAVATAVPLSVSNQEPGSEPSSEGTVISSADSVTPENPSRIVPDEALNKEISFTEKPAAVADTHTAAEAKVAVDTLRADIEQSLAKVSQPEAAKSPEIMKVSFNTDQLEGYFSSIISEAIVKARKEVEDKGEDSKPKITLQSVEITDGKEFLSYKVILRGHKYIFYSDITLTGRIVQSGEAFTLTGPEIKASKKSTVEAAREEISPVFPTILPTFMKTVSAEHGGKKVKTAAIRDGGLEIGFE